MKHVLGFLVLAVVGSGLFLAVGVLTVWMLNTLFGLGLPYTLQAAVAGLLLALLVSGGSATRK